jgi:two-component system, NarL family, invasion response regulator UvrY
MIKLFVADDHPVVREGLKRIILDCSDMSLVGEAADGDEVLEKCDQIDIDVLLMDISMPGPGFLEILQRITLKYPDIRILVLSIHPEDHYAVRAIKAGAAGYLTKNYSPEVLAKAIRHVYTGRKYVSPMLAEKLVSQLYANDDIKLHEALSNREYQILCMIGAGIDTSNIATKLHLSPKTVSTYQSRILGKMNLKSKGELIRYAIEQGLTE